MSGFQYYEFVAVDRRLTEADQDALRRISSRAEITATSLTNSYSYGDFKGDPDDLMDRYFDAMVHVTNWGTRTVRLRVPRATADLPAMRRLTKAQEHLADFLALGDDLVGAAAQASRGGATAATPTKAALAKWVAALPAKQKDAWLVAAALDEGANVGATLLQAYRKAQPKAAAAGPAKAKRRTVAELFAAAGLGTAEV